MKHTNPFRSTFSEDIFNRTYRHTGAETWEELANILVDDVCGEYLYADELEAMKEYITKMKFIPGGRYLYYAGRPTKFFNNCYLLRSLEDSREDWADLSKRVEMCLSTGGGIGNDYSVYRPKGALIRKTGGTASGPIAKMLMINEIGRGVMQGGSRRSAIYASLNWKHDDINDFLTLKNWDDKKVSGAFDSDGNQLSLGDLKRNDFNFPTPMDMTNISVNFDTEWLMRYWQTRKHDDVFMKTIKQAAKTGDPGFSFNFFEKERETLRNACTEVTSEDDSDVCNLGSVNMSRIEDITDFANAVHLGTLFLLCGTMKAHLPYEKVHQVREKNRRLGLGLMGVHEWFIRNNLKYEVGEEFERYLKIYKSESDRTAREGADRFSISRPVARRAIAPTGTIGIIAGTTTGIEPLYAVAYKRRYFDNGVWKAQYYVDHMAKELIEQGGLDPDSIESAVDLAADFERRVKFQYDIQRYVDMGISSTINLPSWGSELNNEDTVDHMADVVARYAHGLRGITFYPDGARGGQPLNSVPYHEAKDLVGQVIEETNDVCDITGKGGFCGS